MEKKFCPGRGPGFPEGRDDVINKYGTYEVQATSGTENEYPMIAQGLGRKDRNRKDPPPGGGC